ARAATAAEQAVCRRARRHPGAPDPRRGGGSGGGRHTTRCASAGAGRGGRPPKRGDARRKATAALAGQVGAEAVSQPRIDLAMLLAVQAVKLHDSPQTESTLLATLLRSPSVIGEMASPIDSRPQRLVVSPDGRTVAVSDNNGNVRLYDVATRSVTATLRNYGFTQPVAFIGDGSQFASYGYDPKSN